MSDAELRGQVEALVRTPAEFIYDATVINISADHVFIVPAGSKTVKRDVRLAEHIKRELLFVGMKVKAHDIRGKPYIVAIFDTGQSALKLAGMPVLEEDESGLPPGQDLLMFPVPDVAGTCDGWTITWQAVQGAESYVVYWAEDAEGLNAAELGTTEELVYEAALDTADPPKCYFALKAVNANKESAISPYLTDESSAAFQIPGGFTVCPVGSGYRIDVDAEIDLTADAVDFDHWELEWADDDEGLNGAKWGDVVPEDLPLIISSTAPGQWTFDTDTDETWGKLHGASPDEWDADGNTAAGSRIIYDGEEAINPDATNPVYSGRIEQAFPQFTGTATDSLTFYIKVVTSGTPTIKARMDPGTYITVPVQVPGGPIIDEYEAQSYARPPYTYTEVEATGDWQEITVAMPAEAVGQPIGFIGIKVTVTGAPVSQILADDIVWGPGGVQPATQKWFRLRAASCMGLFGPYTDWLSGWSEQIIFEEPYNYGSVAEADQRIRFRVDDNLIELMLDGETWTDVTADITPPANLYGDDPAPAADNIEWIQVEAAETGKDFYFLGRREVDFSWRTYLLHYEVASDPSAGTWNWLALSSAGMPSTFTDESWPGYTFFDFQTQDGWEGASDETYTAMEWRADDPGFAFTPTEINGGWWGPPDAGQTYSGSFMMQSTFKCNFSLAGNAVAAWWVKAPGWPGACGNYLDLDVSADGINWTNSVSAVNLGSAASWWNGAYNTIDSGGTYNDVYLRIRWGTVKNGGCIGSWSYLEGIALTGFTIIPDSAPYPIAMDVSANRLIVTAVDGDTMVTIEMPISEENPIPVKTPVLPCTVAQVTAGIYSLYPRLTPDDELLLYGRIADEEGLIIQVLTLNEDGTVVKLTDETDWMAEDAAGGLVITSDNEALVVRHSGTKLSLTTLNADNLIYTLINGEEEAIKVGIMLANPLRGTGRLITGVDLETDTIEFETPPVETWVAGDELLLNGVAELQSFPATNLTVDVTPELLVALPFTINFGAIDIGELGGVMLGNRLDEDEMVAKLEPPYDLVTDATEDFTVAAPIVALKWSESGCLPAMIDDQAGTDPDGNPVLPPLPPPSDDSGGQVPITPDPGDPIQAPGWGKLRHDQLTELGDDDHPQYHNDARGDVRYYTKTDLQTSGDAQVHWDNVINEPASFPAGGDAGGVLSGTYPNPGFAVDMATELELEAHIDDTAGAHAASAISLNTAAFDGNLSAADDTVQKALDTIDDLSLGGGDVAGETHAADEKTTPADADELPLVDSAAAWVLKKLTWTNIKATLKTYFDGLYTAPHPLLSTANHTDTSTSSPPTAGDIIYAGNDALWKRLPFSATKFLWTNSVSGLPAWHTLVAADISDVADITRIWPAENENIGQDGTKYASVTALIAGLSAGEVGYLGPRNSNESVTVNKAVTLIGPGRESCKFTVPLIIDPSSGIVRLRGIGVELASGVDPAIATYSGTIYLNDVRGQHLTAEDQGVGLYVSGGIVYTDSDCHFYGNGAVSNLGVWLSAGSSLSLNGPIVQGNVYQETAAYGWYRDASGNPTYLSQIKSTVANGTAPFEVDSMTVVLNLNAEFFQGYDVSEVYPVSTHAATGKTTPVDADEIGLVDSAASWVLKKLTWANLKATLKTYFDTLYSLTGHTHGLNSTTVSKLVASDGSPDSLTSDAAGALTVGVSIKLPGSAQVVDDIDTTIADDDTALATSGAVFDAISNIMKGYAEATSTTINSTGSWNTINGMSVTATINKGEALVIIQMHGYQSPAGQINWQLRALLDGATASSGAPQNYSTGSLATVSTNILIERFTGLSAASHTFVAQVMLNTSSVSVVFGDANTRNCSITVLEL